jgi:hypothetical protein
MFLFVLGTEYMRRDQASMGRGEVNEDEKMVGGGREAVE